MSRFFKGIGLFFIAYNFCMMGFYGILNKGLKAASTNHFAAEQVELGQYERQVVNLEVSFNKVKIIDDIWLTTKQETLIYETDELFDLSYRKIYELSEVDRNSSGTIEADIEFCIGEIEENIQELANSKHKYLVSTLD